jgi:hypothetical protein
VKALARVLSARWLWLGLGLLQLLLAASFAAPVRAALRAAMGPFTIGDEAQLLGPLFELVAHHPSVSAAMLAGLALSGGFALVLAPLLAGAVISRLAGPCSAGEQARAGVTYFPAALVIGLYGLILRALLALVAAVVAPLHSLLPLVVIAASLGLAALVVDLARARVVLAGANGYHPRTFIRALTSVSPGLWLRSTVLSAAQWAVACGILLVAVHGMGTAWSLWAARGLTLLATFFALWRVAVAVEATRAR